MPDTNTQQGTSRIRQLLTATRKAPRKLRIAGAAGLITLAGTVALVAAPAAANAATAATVVNPNCPLPTTQPWQYEGSVTSNLSDPERMKVIQGTGMLCEIYLA
jgi:hypothetical protein